MTSLSLVTSLPLVRLSSGTHRRQLCAGSRKSVPALPIFRSISSSWSAPLPKNVQSLNVTTTPPCSQVPLTYSVPCSPFAVKRMHTIRRSRSLYADYRTRRKYATTSDGNESHGQDLILKEKEAIVSHDDMDLIRSAPETTSSSPTQEQHLHDPYASIPGAEKGGRKLAIVYTCGVCETRSAQKFTERAYRHGVVICRCPGCDHLHLIADRLGYFEDRDGGGWDIQKFFKAKGKDITTITDETVIEIMEKMDQGDDEEKK